MHINIYGLILDSKLLFVNHINEKIKLAKKGIGVLKYLSQYLALKTLDQMYKMFVRPIFDYCDVIYHSPHLTNPFDSTIKLNPLMERIEKIQYQAALAITCGWQGSSRIKLYEELGWESLSDRRWYRRLFQLFKIRNNMTPAYLRGNIPRQRSLLFGNCNPNIYHENRNLGDTKNIYLSIVYQNNDHFHNINDNYLKVGKPHISAHQIQVLVVHLL